jgi:peptide/nickel transport system substrate-binding protein
MSPAPRRRILPAAVLATAASLVVLAGWAFDRPASGQDPAPAPAPAQIDLLTVAPYDKIVLTDNTVLYVDPVLPRPLPALDPSREAKRRAKREIPKLGNISLPGEKQEKIEVPKDDDDDPATKLTIHLLQGEVRDFTIRRTSLRSIDYFEDMLLAEADRLTLARDFTHAFECCMRVRARDPKWKGLDDTVNRLLFAEGNAALLNGDAERGLRLLGELWTRKRDFPGLADKLAASYGGRAGHAFELGLYALGRKILHDAEVLAPNHILLREVRERFVNRARSLADGAAKADGPARVDALAESLRIWPTLEGTDAAYRSAFAAEPTLEVAVNDVPRGLGPWVRSPADARVSRLLYQPILARDDDEALTGASPGQLAAKLTATDLGRRLVVELRPGVMWSDGSRPVSAIDLARALTDSVEPVSPRFNARWFDLLERVDTPDETHVEIRLTRATLKPGSWLTGPVGPAHAGGDGRVVTADRGRTLVVDGPYRWASSGNDRAVLSTPVTKGDSHPVRIRRIKETRYPSVAQTLGAFARGEVALVENVPPDRVAALKATPDVSVGRYARPTVHVIALDGRNKALKNRRLRRALSYAIDRKTLLEETLLRRASDEASRVADGVFRGGDYADAPDVTPLGYDPILARALVVAARKEMGGDPIRLNFEYPATPAAQAVATKLVEMLRLSGVEVTAVERPESVFEGELRSGRRFDLAYRALSYAEPVIDAGPLIVPGYDAPPSSDPLASVASDRILQLLLQLERAPEWPTAKGLAVQIDRECRDELPVLPLWQVEDHYAWHTRLKGVKESAASLYEGVETWEVEPWFARDAW